MEKLKLVIPNEKYLDDVEAYKEEFLAINSSMDGCGPLRYYDAKEWLEEIKKYTKEETLPEGKVIATQFLFVRESDNRIIGLIQVRHYFSEYLRLYGGNIGYSIRPSERRKGYAKEMLKMVLPFCKEIGLEKVLITCLEENEASRRTILANGGVYENTIYNKDENQYFQRYWISLK